MTTVASLWWWFWVVWFLVAGLSFAVIAAVVMFKGVGDLRTMIEILEARHREGARDSN